ncbi:MAG: hypothetical protein ACTHW1_09980 [Ancrocorticia sp.]|uniref:hypothetical protein n=1 Tax=Ancrocorticia sp. TaxID=2593684 RepID=UPI003F8E924A
MAQELTMTHTLEVDMAEDLAQTATRTVNVLVCSDDSATRQEVLTAVGHKAGPSLPDITWQEAATPDMARAYVEQGNFDLLILDGESPKLGGMGLGKMIHDEIDPDIPFIVILGRPQDEWLARWSGAAAAVSFPIDPRELAGTVDSVLTRKLS